MEILCWFEVSVIAWFLFLLGSIDTCSTLPHKHHVYCSISLVVCSADIGSLISSGTYSNLHAQKAFNVLLKLSLNYDDLICRSADIHICLSVISCVLILWTWWCDSSNESLFLFSLFATYYFGPHKVLIYLFFRCLN